MEDGDFKVYSNHCINNADLNLETKVTKLSQVKAPTGHSATPGGGTGTPGGAGAGNYTFKLWSLDKGNSKAENSMIKRDGRTWYWCDNHTYNNKGVVTQVMYVFHSSARSMMHGAQRKIASKRVVPRSMQ